MKRIIGLFLLIIIFTSCIEQSKEVKLSEELSIVSKNLDQYFSALTMLKKFNGVLLAYKNDSLLLEKAFNIYQSHDSSSYITTYHQFDIHSVSKLMTQYLIIRLNQEGIISESQTINQFYPDFPNGEMITIEMLLNHSSGLPRELQNLTEKEINLTSDDIISLAQKQNLLFQPGEDIQYSNVGYELLYNLISKIYKKPFAQCVIDEIFVPLNMNHSGSHFFTKHNRLQNLAKNHVLQDSILFEVPNILEDEFKTARLYSTISDLNIFLKELENEPYKSKLQNENGLIAKDGGSKGIRAQVYADLNHNFRYVLLANYDEMPFSKTIEDIAKIMKKEPVEIPKELNRKSITLSKAFLQKYVGSYSFADFDGLMLKVDIEDDYLIVLQDNEKIAHLKAETETIFFENSKSAESFEFFKNDSNSYNVMMGWKGISVEGKRK